MNGETFIGIIIAFYGVSMANIFFTLGPWLLTMTSLLIAVMGVLAIIDDLCFKNWVLNKFFATVRGTPKPRTVK